MRRKGGTSGPALFCITYYVLQAGKAETAGLTHRPGTAEKASAGRRSAERKSMKIKSMPMENQHTIPLFIPPPVKYMIGKSTIATRKHMQIVAFLTSFLKLAK